MLVIYRRHQKKCGHKDEGRTYRRCRCMIWADGFLSDVEIRKSLRTRNWDKAQETIRQWEAEGQDTKPSAGESIPTSIEQAWQTFLADLEKRNLSRSTIRKYRLLSRQMEAFASRTGLRFLVEFDLLKLREFRIEWKDGPLSSAKKLERLRAFFRFSIESGGLIVNPALKLRAPQIKQRPTLPFTTDEMIRILAALDPFYDQIASSGRNSARRLRGLVLLLRYSGMRIGDAVKLSTGHVSGNKLFLYTQKSGVPVYTVLPDFVVRALGAVPRVTPTHFFWDGVSSLEGVVGSWQKRLRKLFELAKISDGHAHRFRDTFATDFLLAAVPIERVAVLLGHQSVKVTEKYYAAWTASRQRQIEADLQRAWDRDPVLLLEAKGTPQVHGKTEAVN